MAPWGAVCLNLQVLNPNLVPSSSFKHFICSMFERVKSNLHGFPPHSCLQMSSVTDHFNTDFATMCKKIPHYLRQLTRQMADCLIAQHYFLGVLVHRVVKLSFCNKFFSDWWFPYVLINMISTHSWCESEHFHVVWLPSYRFASLSFIFIQIPSFSFQLWV